MADHPLVDSYLAAATRLLDVDPAADADAQLRLDLDLERHAALYALGRADEVDQLYQRIRQQCGRPLVRAEAAWVQISSLTNRGKPQAGLDLGLETLAELGSPAPAAADLAAETNRGLDALTCWVAQSDETADQDRASSDDPYVRARAHTINRMIPAAYFCQSALFPWMLVESYRLWETGGPDRTLVGPLGITAAVTIAQREDYDTGHAVLRRVLRVGEQRGYEPETSEARYQYAVSVGPWFDPLEESVRQAHLARAGLIRGGDIQFAGYTYYASVTQLLDCAPTLDEALAEIDSGLTFAARTGNGFLAATLVAYQQAVRTLRGETDALGSPNDAAFDERTHLASLADNQTAVVFYHLVRGLVATIFCDEEQVRRNTLAARPLLPLVAALHCRTMSQVVRALELAATIKTAAPPAAAQARAELDECQQWLDRRANTQPASYLHLRCLVDAELAWALGEAGSALRGYDQAQREVAPQRRPWHQALITERLARFHLSQGIEHAGRTALREARRIYQGWGATGKVAQLNREFPFLQAVTDARISIDPRRSANVSAETVDMLAVLRASQALSSETNLIWLRERVAEVLRDLDACSLMVVPIRTRGEPRAMLILENRHSRAAFGANRLDAVLLITGQLSVSLDNALLYADLERKVTARTEALKEVNDQLELLAITDPLTGLANRRRLTDMLDAEWRSALRTQTSIGIAMLDIDHFKLYNDHYGHPAGDRCLRGVATAIGRTIRDTDLLARYGGEEFVIVLPGASAAVTMVVAERVRQSVADLAEPHLRTTAQIVTISVGIATTVPTPGTSAEQLIKLADTELYRAKGAGRNRISVSADQ